MSGHHNDQIIRLGEKIVFMKNNFLPQNAEFSEFQRVHLLFIYLLNA